MNNVLNSQNMSFSLHPAIIYKLITKQASGLHKSFLELAMNSVDAGATRIDFTLTETGFIFSDNGHGFETEQKIVDCFETFGTPHDESETNGKYARYRLGRAQMFSYAKTEWHSLNFLMTVDLKNELVEKDETKPLAYTLEHTETFHQGCKITGCFYKKIYLGEFLASDDKSISEDHPDFVMGLIPQLQIMLKYLPVDVYLNGVKINHHPQDNPIAQVKENIVYILKNKYQPPVTQRNGVIQVYNKGVFAYQMRSKYAQGDIVSLDAIDLNIARNAPKTTCLVAKNIKLFLDATERKIENQHLKGGNVDINVDVSEFVDNFWRSLLGLKETEESHALAQFQENISLKIFAQGNDTKISISQFVDELNRYYSFASKVANRKDSNKLHYFTMDTALASLFSSREKIRVKNGFIPLHLLPSKELIDQLPSTITIANTLVHHLFYETANRIYDTSNLSLAFSKVSPFINVNLDGLDWNAPDHYDQIYGYLIRGLIVVTSLQEFCSKLTKYGDPKDFFNSKTLLSANFFDTTIWPITVKVVKHSIVDLKPTKADLTPYEQIVKEALSSVLNSGQVALQIREALKDIYEESQDKNFRDRAQINRKVDVILDDDAFDSGILAWTNGIDYVHFEQNYFKKCVEENNLENLLFVGLHEMSHLDNSYNSSIHGATFNYINTCLIQYLYIDLMTVFKNNITSKLIKTIEKNNGIEGLSINEKTLKSLLLRPLEFIISAAG